LTEPKSSRTGGGPVDNRRGFAVGAASVLELSRQRASDYVFGLAFQPGLRAGHIPIRGTAAHHASCHWQNEPRRAGEMPGTGLVDFEQRFLDGSGRVVLRTRRPGPLPRLVENGR
jgi:hypothetical protein